MEAHRRVQGHLLHQTESSTHNLKSREQTGGLSPASGTENELLFREEASSKKSRNSLVTVIIFLLFYIFGKKPGK